MILELYILLLIITFSVIGFGYYIDNIILKVIGCLFLFLEGLQLELGISYSIGSTIETVNASFMNVNNVYSTFQSHMFGFYLMIIASLWILIIFLNYRSSMSEARQ